MVKIEELSEEQLKDIPVDIKEALISWKDEIIKARSLIWNLNKEVKNGSNEEALKMAKLLVEQNPANVDKISDGKIQAKILQEKWGVDNLEELKVMFPDYAKIEGDDNQDDATELETLQREMKLMKYQNTKTKTKEALENIALSNKDVVSTIADFEEKMKEELKFISESVEPNERIKKAFALVTGSNGNSADAYSIMQWITIKKSPKDDKENEASLLREQNDFRKLLGLKTK